MERVHWAIQYLDKMTKESHKKEKKKQRKAKKKNQIVFLAGWFNGPASSETTEAAKPAKCNDVPWPEDQELRSR